MTRRVLQYTVGAVGVIAGAAVAGFGSGIGNAYGRHLLASGQLPLPGAPKRLGRTAPAMSKAERTLREMLRIDACMREEMNRPQAWTYNGVADYVLDRGRAFRKSEPLTPLEWEALTIAVGRQECRQKECYYNAQKLAKGAQAARLVTGFDGTMRYVEGYGITDNIPLAIHHGWVEINGKVVDLTWRTKDATHGGRRYRDRIVGIIPPGYAYIGIPFPERRIAKLREPGYNLLGDWRGKMREFQHKRKSPIDCTGIPSFKNLQARGPT